jgi:hypothetical protein
LGLFSNQYSRLRNFPLNQNKVKYSYNYFFKKGYIEENQKIVTALKLIDGTFGDWMKKLK